MIILVLVNVSAPVQERLSTILEFSDDESFAGRLRSWGYGFQMVSWYPLTGVGIGQWMNYHGLAAHNTFVQVLAETGPIGFILYISILVVTYKQLIQRIKMPTDNCVHKIELRMMAVIMITMHTGYLTYIFLGNHAYSAWTFFYIGLSTAVANIKLPNNMDVSEKE